MAYPGKAARRGDGRIAVGLAVQQRLNEVGCGPVDVDGVFGGQTESSVRLLQTRRGLLPDGVVGPLTWEVLFAEPRVPRTDAPVPLLRVTLEKAATQLGVRETPGTPNRGPEVDAYLRRVGLDPAGGFAWCQAFVYWCFDEAAKSLLWPNPCVRTAGVLRHWVDAPPATRVHADRAFDDPALVRPGAVFVIDHGSGRGHAGLVTAVVGGEIETIEGNTNLRGSREGDGVLARVRTLGEINVGFVDYGR